MRAGRFPEPQKKQGASCLYDAPATPGFEGGVPVNGTYPLGVQWLSDYRE